MPRKALDLKDRDRGQVFSVYYPDKDLVDISSVKSLVDSGEFGSISDFIRVAVREKLSRKGGK